MADPFAKMKSGDVFEPTAEMVNGWNDAARAFHSGRLNQGGRPISGALLPGQVLIENRSSADRDIHDCLAIDPGNLSLMPDGSDDDFVIYRPPVLFGVTPGPDFMHFGKFVVCAEPIAAGEIGRAWMSGIFWARIKGKGSHCDLFHNENKWLRAGPFGHARILWAKDGHYLSAEERMALIQFPNPQLCFIGFAQQDVGKNLTGSARAVNGPSAGGTPTDPEIIVPDIYNPGPKVTEGDRMEVKWINEHWEYGDGDCPVPDEEEEAP